MSIDFDTPGTGDEQPDWLTDSMDDEDLGGGGDGGGGNRLFLIIAIGLIGLIVLGLFAVGGLLFIRNLRNSQEQQIAAATATLAGALAAKDVIPTATNTPTPLPPTVTNTPTIAPTNTRVIQDNGNGTGDGNGDQPGPGDDGEKGGGGGDQATPTPKPTDTPVPVATPAGGVAEVPNTGFGGFEAVLVAIGLVGVLVISRRLRHTG